MNKKTLILLVATVLALFAILVIVLFSFNRNENRNEWTYEKHGWINCQPPLNQSEAKFCKEAEDAGYKYIAY